MIVPGGNDRTRSLILQYFYNRAANASSLRGKRGAAVKMMDLRRDLKQAHNLTVQQVTQHLVYLISQGWVEKQEHNRVVPTDRGKQIPSITTYYIITAAGIDKFEGPSEFTPRDRFAGIVNVHANGPNNIVTVGDGNQVQATHQQAGEALATLADAIRRTTELDPETQMDSVAIIDSIQAQLARSRPDTNSIQRSWSSLESLGKIASLSNLVLSVGAKLATYFG